MSKTAQKTDPKLWEKVKTEVTRGGKGGEPGQWSARKAQLAVQEYKKRGGGYLGPKSRDNSLNQWAGEDWGTKSGGNSRETGERYLPKKARQALSDSDGRAARGEKRVDPAKSGKASAGPKARAVADKTAKHRSAGKASARSKQPRQNKDQLLIQARYLDIEGRSNMLKSELLDAIRLAKH
jgi:Family of unknown function (DUF5872)